ncbi:SAM-dependent DNA methyltransferase [Streptomyces sp. FT05W]|nr:SAM-dependent DNA methyltransferase [Streptomyces sp. FT05W]
MNRLTLAQLERHLWSAADILRGAMDVTEYEGILTSLLYLKRANDEPDGALPEHARWERLGDPVGGSLDEQLHSALSALGERPGRERIRDLYAHIRFSAVDSRRLARLIAHFGRIRLRDEDLAYPGMLGDAYAYLVESFADAAGRKGGEFFTPRGVVRLMTELADPQPGMRIYDPCVGTGGLLVSAAQYVEEHGGNPNDLTFVGQDPNHEAWSSATMNMLTHGLERFTLERADALTHPVDAGDGFDLVMSNPPFSMNYRIDEVPRLDQRMPYGHTPERGKADLMFLQHMLDMAVGRGGSVVSVLPMGVLFRGNQEQAIRSRLLDADVIEAVIGLGPNLFYGTGIPVCLIVLRSAGQRDPEHQGSVLFINAENEFHQGRAQNTLLPEHVRKISTAFHSRQEIPGFSRIVPRDALAENDDNLTVRRYVPEEATGEQQDLQAHLKGGMPVSEVTQKLSLLASFGLEPSDLFLGRAGSPTYLDFRPRGERPNTASLTAVARGREQELWNEFEKSWPTCVQRITAHLSQRRAEPHARPALAALRVALTEAIREPLFTVGLLDGNALDGAIAGWWQDSEHTLRSLAANGFPAVVDGWCDEVEALLGRSGSPHRGDRPSALGRGEAYRHPVIAALLPEFFGELERERAKKADLDAQYEELEPEGWSAAPESKSEEDITRRDFKRARREIQARIRNLEKSFSLTAARSRLDGDGLRSVVITVLRNDLAGRLSEKIVQMRNDLVSTYASWERKYGLSFQEIEDRLPGATETSRALRQTPWSERGSRGEQDEKASVLFNIIDAEKKIEAEEAKLEIKQHFVLHPVLESAEKQELKSSRLALGEVLHRFSYGVAVPLSTDTRGTPVVAARNLTPDGLDLTALRYTTEPVPAAARIRPGDILVARVRPHEDRSPLRFAVWRGEIPGATFSHAVSRLVPNKDLLLADYLEAWLRHPRVLRQLEVLSWPIERELLNTDIVLPPLERQVRMVHAIGKLAAERADRKIELAKVRLIRAALRSSLLGGDA